MGLKRWITILMSLAFILYVSFWLLVGDEYLSRYFGPSFLTLVLFLATGVALHFTRTDIGRAFCFIWWLWPIVGAFFTVGHYYKRYLRAPFFLDPATQTYLINALALIIGFLIVERIAWRPRDERETFSQVRPNLPAYVLWPLIIFPLAYAMSLLASGPTLLTGGNIADDMYAINRGPLYELRILLPFCAALAALSFRKRTNRVQNWVLAYLPVVLLASCLDGKRDMLMLSMACIGFIWLLSSKTKNATPAVLGGAAVIIVYGFLAQVRAGAEDIGFGSVIQMITIVGVEFRDYAHSFNFWTPDYMAAMGYDWWRSTMAMVLNRQVLSVFGVDKDAWVIMDSARTWQRAFDLDVGIRIGLIGEFFYAFREWAFIASATFGAVSGVIVNAIYRAKNTLPLAGLLVLLASATMAVFNQSSAWAGAATTLGYVYALLWASSRIRYAPSKIDQKAAA